MPPPAPPPPEPADPAAGADLDRFLAAPPYRLFRVFWECEVGILRGIPIKPPYSAIPWALAGAEFSANRAVKTSNFPGIPSNLKFIEKNPAFEAHSLYTLNTLNAGDLLNIKYLISSLSLRKVAIGKSYNLQPQEDAILIDSEKRVRLGELLVDSGVVSSADLTEAIQVSTRLNIPIGRVLLLSGLVSPVTLEAALEAQPLLNQNKESRQNVIQALKEVDLTGRSLDKTLTGAHSEYARRDGIGLGKDKLAELLLDSEIVSQDQLDQALSTSFEAGVPLGSALVLEGILSPSLFPSILQIQQKVRTGAVSKDEAIEEVKSTFMHWLKAEESLSGRSFGATEEEEEETEIEPSVQCKEETAAETSISITFEPESEPQPGNPRLVDLLIESGRFKRTDVNKAFNRVLANPQKSAELFELLGLINHETMKDAIKCQSLIKRGHLSRKEARYVLDTSLSEPLEVEEKKLKPYFDRDYRKSLFSKVMGGMVVGAAVAGLSLLKSRGK